jgi:phosphoribosylglycinamide formyltransferase-1
MMRLAFLASNNGSSFRAIIAAIEGGALSATPVLVVSNRANAPALDFARAHAIPAHHVATLPNPAIGDERLAALLAAAGADLVILSGYLRKLGPKVLGAFGGRILNIHPALLPRHGGQGMYGRRVHEAVLSAGDTFTGASVHWVDDEYDQGPVLAQVRIPVNPYDTPESLEAKVMAAEPQLYIDVLKRITTGTEPVMTSGAAR